MRYSQLFGKTRHNPPCDADSVNAKLLTQAGFVEKLAAGIYNLLPLGQRVFRKVCDIVREEMNAIDGQEILMPSLHPIDLWKATGRERTMDEILYRTNASGGKEFVFGPSHEEVVTPLVGKHIQSYKDLPLSVYQLQSKFRDEPRAKSGLLRGREFGMKDMYSFHVSEEDLDEYYERSKVAYSNVFDRCGLETYIIEASGGPFSDKYSHEFTVISPVGEDTVIICKKCDTAQNLEIAEGKEPDPDVKEEKEMPLEEVTVERGLGVKESAEPHGVSISKVLKTVVYEIEGEGLLGVVIRGDLSVNEVKLENYIGKKLRTASPEMLKEAGLVQGFISPVNMPEKVGISFIGDHSIKNVKNFVTGANVYGKDYKNVNVGRDFVIKDFTDLVEVGSGFSCPKCGTALTEKKGIEVGNIFKLGTRFSEVFKVKVSDSSGKLMPAIMGCYGIGTTRLIASIVEVHHDDKGIIWPKSVAPYTVFLASLGKDDIVVAKSEALYKELNDAGVEVLYDDRDASAGVKLNDADLLGLPVRLVVSKRTLENESVEWKLRSEEKTSMVEIDSVIEKLKKL